MQDFREDPTFWLWLAVFGPAAAADTEQIQSMTGGDEPGRLGRPMQRFIERALGAVVEFEVENGAALGADQMVVMLGQPFGKFVASKVVVGHDARDCTCVFEQRQIPIDAGLSQRGVDGRDFMSGERTIALLQGRYEPATAAGVALADGSQHGCNFFIDVGTAHCVEVSGHGGRRE